MDDREELKRAVFAKAALFDDLLTGVTGVLELSGDDDGSTVAVAIPKQLWAHLAAVRAEAKSVGLMDDCDRNLPFGVLRKG